MSKYNDLRQIDVSQHIESKNGFNYLSWSHAVDVLLQHDENATWEFREPVNYNDTFMVFCTVKAFGKERTAHLPVLNFRNQAIKSPDSMQVNTAMQRCLAKAIALHGIGLYIYNGEDIPLGSPVELIEKTYKEQGLEGARALYNRMNAEDRKECQAFIEKIRGENNGTEE